MVRLKCIGCYELRREKMELEGKQMVVYNCPRFFPYATTIGGLLRPGTGIIEAANDCPDDPLSHCAVCSDTKITHYGQDIVSICKKHDAAWAKPAGSGTTPGGMMGWPTARQQPATASVQRYFLSRP
ncbi:unnamed protein product [marine sediment metagenome]|uniref:Uncharacterized protein n=1 Tax=marine sediment metagenome TaxID=412755 RepID=X1Q6Z2_9ZZZZ